MVWPFYYAWKQLFPTGRKISFFALMAIAGVALGVMVLVVVMSVMNGFDREIRSRMINISGDVQVRAPSILKDPASVLALIQREQGVAECSPFAEGIVMMQHGGHPDFPFIHGLEPKLEGQAYERYMVLGHINELHDNAIILGGQLAQTLGASEGSKVDVYTPLMLEKMKSDEILLPTELTVVGIFETGWNEVDAHTALCTLGRMQELYGLGAGVHGFCLRLKSGVSPETIATSLNQQLPAHVTAYTWLERHQDLLFLLNVEKTTMAFIILFIVIVACFSIASSLMISVYRKTREIGLLVAMGARQSTLAFAFCIQGAILGLLGTTIGCIGAILVLHFRQPILNTFNTFTHGESAFLKYYAFSNIPVAYDILTVACIILGTLILTILAGWIPARRALKLNAAEALRYE